MSNPTATPEAPSVVDDPLALKVLDIVDRILAPQGLAQTHGYHPNPQQWDYARRVAMVLCAYDHANEKTALGMLEAGTGLGKTLAYLVALFAHAAVTGQRAAISTHSRQLQRQMLGKDAECVADWIADLTAVRLTIARRVGKQNYVSPGKIDSLLHNLRIGRQKGEQERMRAIREFLLDLKAWREAGGGVLDDFLQEGGQDLPDGLTPGQVTLDQHSDADEAAPYHADVAASKIADVLVINHSLLVLHAFRWGNLLDDADSVRPVRSVVVDEAHKLPGIAESVLSDSLSVSRFSQLSRRIADDLGQTQQGEWHSLHEMLTALSTFLTDQHQGARYSTAQQIGSLPERLAGAAKMAVTASRQLAQLVGNNLLSNAYSQDMLYEALDHCHDLSRIASALGTGGGGTPIVSWSPVREYPSLSVGAPDAGRTLSRLWAPLSQDNDTDSPDTLPPRPVLNAVVFTSATLSVPGEAIPKAFDGFSRQLGINRHPSKTTGKPVHNVQVELMVRHEPTDFGEMRFVLADPAVHSPTRKQLNKQGDVAVVTDPAWLAYSAAMLIEAQQGSLDRVLALTLSWRDTQALAEQVRKLAPDMTVIEHQRGAALRSVLQSYRETPGAVLITPSGWEGVDLPGLVPNVFIHRIPFPPPERDEQMRLRLHLRSIGYSHESVTRILQQHDQEQVRQVLAQGLGRGIRARSDACCVWIADPRFPLPQAWAGSFDPELEKRAGKRLTSAPRSLLACIPQRFRSESFEQAQLFLDGLGCYTPEDI
ncbi:helicase C-terminal domain-containing protein [Vreelandella rituensis]|uniref:Helicase ATP-binding domain-containing protein n=1 Tax=Vreelandella rituensis TaxID=2282306 RepID=A0A368UAU2_9GAMM|nr:helicase C-terminal domain-containing protein [Halomonas rituensis]RCV93766.1 hypothetical protein DU506_01015 [Halomonas rituensis]